MIKDTDNIPYANRALFDFPGGELGKLFESVEFPWEVLNNLDAFFESFFNTHEGNTQNARISPQAALISPSMIWVGKDVIVEPGAYIEGPCVLGDQTVVRHGAYVRGKVITGKGCVIGHATEIKGSILLDGAKASHFAYIGDSILGNRVNLGAGTRLANLRLDKGKISLRVDKEKILTGRKKLGAILGDGAQTGCNCVTNPGTVFARETLAYPLTNPKGFYPKGSIISK